MAESAAVRATLLATEDRHFFQLLEGVMHGHEDRRYTLFGLLQQVLQIKKGGLILVLVDECRCNSRFPTTAYSSQVKGA